MRNKTKLISIVLSLSALMMLVSCQQQKAEWRGTIEEVDGVTVVKNPKEPMYGEEVFSLEEELSIGEAEGREEYMFSEIRSMVVDEAGRIYVLDWKEIHVKVFDQNGTYIRTIGKKGQGPGEFVLPLSVSITRQNELVVNDYRSRLALFSLEGEFKKNIQIAKVGLSRIGIDSEGNIVGRAIVREEENPRYELKKFDSELNYLHSLGFSPLPSASRDGFNPFGSAISFRIDNYDQVICGYPENYEINIFDKKGNLTRKILKDYNPVEITEEEIKEGIEGLPQDMKLSIPKYHFPYSRFTTDDEGRIFVQTYEKTADGSGYYCDVFDSEGKYIAKIPLKAMPIVWKMNKLYTIKEDEEGFQVVRRYQVRWKY